MGLLLGCVYATYARMKNENNCWKTDSYSAHSSQQCSSHPSSHGLYEFRLYDSNCIVQAENSTPRPDLRTCECYFAELKSTMGWLWAEFPVSLAAPSTCNWIFPFLYFYSCNIALFWRFDAAHCSMSPRARDGYLLSTLRMRYAFLFTTIPLIFSNGAIVLGQFNWV